MERLRAISSLTLLTTMLALTADADDLAPVALLQARRPVKGLDEALPDTVEQLAFSQDGTRLVSWTLRAAVLWDLKSGKVIKEANRGESLALAAEEVSLFQMPVSAGGGVCEMLTGKSLPAWKTPPPSIDSYAASFCNPCISPDGKLITRATNSVGRDSNFKKKFMDEYVARPADKLLVGDASTGKLKYTLSPHLKPLPPADSDQSKGMPPICQTEFSRDSRHLAAATGDGCITVWEMQTGNQVAVFEPGQKGVPNGLRDIEFQAITWLDNHREMIIVDVAKSSFTRWEFASDTFHPLLMKPQAPAPSAPDPMPKAKKGKNKGKALPTPTAPEKGKPFPKPTAPDKGPPPSGPSPMVIPSSYYFSPDGRRLLGLRHDHSPLVEKSFRREGAMRLIDVADGTPLGIIPGIRNDGPWAIRFSPDSKRVAIGSYLGDVLVFNVETLDQLARNRQWLEGSPPVPTVENPEYTSFKDCKPGTTVEFQATWKQKNNSWSGTVTSKLDSRIRDEIRLTGTSAGVKSDGTKTPNSYFLAGGIVPSQIVKDKPMQLPCFAMMGTGPRNPSLTKTGQETIEIGGKRYDCTVYKYEEKQEKAGILKSGKIWICSDVPGLVVRHRGTQTNVYGPYETEIELTKVDRK